MLNVLCDYELNKYLFYVDSSCIFLNIPINKNENRGSIELSRHVQSMYALAHSTFNLLCF